MPWIELNRQKYEKPLAEELKKLSGDHPAIDIHYLILSEKGFSSEIIENGDARNKSTQNIWEI